MASFTGAQIAGLVASGADEPVKVSLNPAIDGVDTGLDSKGENILFDFVDADAGERRGGCPHGVHAGADGGCGHGSGHGGRQFTFTLLDQVDHTPLATGGGDAETIALSLASVFVATDFDGDSVVIDAGATVTIENDVPGQNAATVNINVDEDELTGLSTGITDGDGTTTVATLHGRADRGPGGVRRGRAGEGVAQCGDRRCRHGAGLEGREHPVRRRSPTQVNGVAGARTVFTLVQTAGADTVLGTRGRQFTFTLLDQVDHTPLATGRGGRGDDRPEPGFGVRGDRL